MRRVECDSPTAQAHAGICLATASDVLLGEYLPSHITRVLTYETARLSSDAMHTSRFSQIPSIRGACSFFGVPYCIFIKNINLSSASAPNRCFWEEAVR